MCATFNIYDNPVFQTEASLTQTKNSFDKVTHALIEGTGLFNDK